MARVQLILNAYAHKPMPRLLSDLLRNIVQAGEPAPVRIKVGHRGGLQNVDRCHTRGQVSFTLFFFHFIIEHMRSSFRRDEIYINFARLPDSYMLEGEAPSRDK